MKKVPTSHGRKGPRVKTKTVLKSVDKLWHFGSMHISKFWISSKWWQRCETDTNRWPVQISALLGDDRYSIPCHHLRALPLAHVLQWLTACPSSVALTYVHSVYYTLAQYIKPHPCSCLLYRRIVKSQTPEFILFHETFSRFLPQCLLLFKLPE